MNRRSSISFPAAPAWGQAGANGGGDVTNQEVASRGFSIVDEADEDKAVPAEPGGTLEADQVPVEARSSAFGGKLRPALVRKPNTRLSGPEWRPK